MNVFTISQLQQFSGVKAHTIRVWEQRYEAFSPSRSEGNTRYYNDIELKRLLNIKSLLDHGHKISDIAGLKDGELSRIVGSMFLSVPLKQEYYINNLITAALTYDEHLFEKTFLHASQQFDLLKVYAEIILPVLGRTGLMWASNDLNTSQEHFLSNLIRQKMYAAINAVPLPKQPAKKWLLFLPENEFHEIGLLLAAYLLKQAGQQVYYLGTNVANHALNEASHSIKPDSVLLFMVHNHIPEDASGYLQEIKKAFKQSAVFVAGNEKVLDQVTLKGINKLGNARQLQSFLHSIK
ncbi:MAG: MerR family transcriptional regulator [Bacteroidota bacterium]